MVPNEWSISSLDDIAKVTSGGTPSKAKSKYWEHGDIPWVRTTEVQNCIIGQNDIKVHITKDGLNNSSAKLFPRGTILLAMIGQGKTRGQVALLNFEASTNQNCAAIILKKDYHPDYYFYFLLSQYKNFRNLSNSAGQSNLSGGLIKTIKVPVPPIQEQKKIATILGVWDKAICTTECLVDNSKLQKKALMQQLLAGKNRLFNAAGEPFYEVWKEFRFGSIFKERVETRLTDLPLISITSSNGVVERADTGRKDTSNKDKSKYRRICPNDIGYNTMRMWQGVSGLSPMEGIVSPAYTILIPQDGIDPKFASYLFKLSDLIHVFRRNSQGLVSDTWNLKYPHFAKIKWRFPPIEEQKKIAAVLISADKDIKLLEKQLADLRQEKTSLMQQLLTGKRRVKVDDGEAA